MKRAIKCNERVESSIISKQEQQMILDMFSNTENDIRKSFEEDDDELGHTFVVVCYNSNPTYIGWLQDKLRELEDTNDIGFESSGNAYGFYGRTYTFYKYND